MQKLRQIRVSLQSPLGRESRARRVLARARASASANLGPQEASLLSSGQQRADLHNALVGP